MFISLTLREPKSTLHVGVWGKLCNQLVGIWPQVVPNKETLKQVLNFDLKNNLSEQVYLHVFVYVFSVDLVCKEELNLMPKVSDF